MAGENRAPLISSWRARLLRWAHSSKRPADQTRLARTVRELGPLGLALALVVGTVWLLGPGGAGATPNARHASGANSGSAGQAGGALRIARADAHAEYVWQGQDVEVNLALSQSASDCQAPLNGGVCLRYSVLADEQARLVGYGVIPAADVRVTPGAITLRVDTRTVPGFVAVVGGRVRIVASWRAVAGPAGGQQRASVQGAVGAYALASSASGAPAAAGRGSGTSGSGTSGSAGSVIATMLLR